MSDAIEIIRAEPLLTAVIRDVVRPRDLARFVPAACAEVISIHHQLGGRSSGRLLARYQADGTTEAGFEVLEGSMEDPRLLRSHLPAGWVAHAIHWGTYDRLEKSHRAVRDWCAARGYCSASERWEIFAPWQEAWAAEPAAIRTDVYHLIERDTRRLPRTSGWPDSRSVAFPSGTVPHADSSLRLRRVIDSVRLVHSALE